MADETPNQPESTELPAPKERKKGVKGIRTTGKQLPYDSTHCYIQMGSAVQASMEARKAFRRIGIILDDVTTSRSRHAQSVVDRIQDLLNQFSELELMIMKLEKIKQEELVALVGRAFSELRTALGWYQKMLEAHKDEDKEALSPLFDQMKVIIAGLSEVRQQKVAAALAMEERFSKSRREYWNEKREAAEKKGRKGKKGNAVEPVQRNFQPYPVNSVEPEVALDPKELIRQATEQIKSKSQLKRIAAQQREAEKEHGSEPSEE